MDNIFDIIRNRTPRTAAYGSAQQKTQQSQQQQQATVPATPTAVPAGNAVQPASPDLKGLSNKQLVLDWQKNDTPDYRQELLKRMQPTINAAITSFAPGSGDTLAVKAARLTLDTLKQYKPDAGAEPSTYLFTNLKRLSRYNNRMSNIIPQPEGIALDRKKLQDAIDRFQDSRDREPSTAELADLTGFSKKRIERLMDANTVVSESSTLSTDNQRDTFASSDVTDNDYFEYVYDSVDPVNQKIMEWSSGKHSKPVLSNNEIAAKLRITPAAVSQRKEKIRNLMSDVRSLL